MMNKGRIEGFKGKLEKGLNKANQSEEFDIVSLKDSDFQNAIKALEQRRIKFRKGEIDLENIPEDGCGKN